MEKPESVKAEGLGSVRSSKAARLKRIKPGFYKPPAAPDLRAGFPLALPVGDRPSGASGRGDAALVEQSERLRVSRKTSWQVCVAALRFCAHRWGRQLLHAWDRGYAGSPCLGQALRFQVRFVRRRPKGWHLEDVAGRKRPPWPMTRGLRSWEEQYLRDPRRHTLQKVGVSAVRLEHPDSAAPLRLLARSKGRPARSRIRDD